LHPLSTTIVPASVTAPVVAVFGVNPVVPAENDVILLTPINTFDSNSNTNPDRAYFFFNNKLVRISSL
jgi:hypothetical protein